MKSAKAILLQKIYEGQNIEHIALQKTLYLDNGEYSEKCYIILNSKSKSEYKFPLTPITTYPVYIEITYAEYSTLYAEFIANPTFYLTKRKEK